MARLSVFLPSLDTQYVAVAGLPNPRKDHHICMARFARDCLQKTNILFTELEIELGPDTADLGMRIGLHR